MKTTINPTGKDIFKNESAIRYFEEKKRDPHVWQCGIDKQGNVFFAYLNGNVDRYSRRQFVTEAKREHF